MIHPKIIQGGMGAGVSDWLLARAVAEAGQLGVVSGTALDLILARRLQEGDPDGHMRRALRAFPVPEVVEPILNDYFIEGGKPASEPYRPIPLYTATPSVALQQLTTVANFVEVFLAKEGHDGLVGINYLEKIQMPNLASLYGATLAGVDYVCMGAGVPREIPGILDRFARHKPATLRLLVEGADGSDDYRMHFDPAEVIGGGLSDVPRPAFLAIIASSTLAMTLAKKATGRVDGFVIEGYTAGGHNAPPRGKLELGDTGEPVYGPKDEVDLAKIKRLGLPFWLAGGYAEPDQLRAAVDLGAEGVQVGTIFALCEESALAAEAKNALIEITQRDEGLVFTDPVASPTGFPFKVISLDGSLSVPAVYEERSRRCDLGYLRHVYKKADGSLGYRCPAEPVNAYVRKGGHEEDAVGRKCLCNGLMANIAFPQRRKSGYVEKLLITGGDDFTRLSRLTNNGSVPYTAADVIAYLLSEE